jgi:hypothetical protein
MQMKSFETVPQTGNNDDLLLRGSPPERVEIYTQKQIYVGVDVFQVSAKDIFVPEIKGRRTMFNSNGPAMLILDSCSAHHGDEFHRLSVESNSITL